MGQEVKKKRRLKRSIKLKLYQSIILINVCWILLLVGYYGYRLVYFYKMEHKSESETGMLVDNLILDKNIVVEGDGLYEDDGKYIYKGNVDNNYIYYNGLLWRIVSIDKQHNMKLITEENVTSLVYGNNGYLKSPIRNWLIPTKNVNHTGIFLNNLKEFNKYQVSGETCIDVISNVKKTTCKKKEKEFSGLLSLSEYEEARGKNSYLNNGLVFYTSSVNKDNEVYVISKDGEIITEKSGATGFRAMITLKNNVKLVSGDGTANLPYQVKDEKVDTLKDAYVGQYVTISNSKYRIISNDSNVIKLALEGVIKNDHEFDPESVEFNPESYDNIAYYLNNELINNNKEKSKLIESTYYTGAYNEENHYNYLKTYSDSVKSLIGFLQVGDYFLANYNNVYTLTKATVSKDADNYTDNTIITISSNRIYGDLPTSVKDIRPVISLKGDLKVSGSGTKDKPYEVIIK